MLKKHSKKEEKKDASKVKRGARIRMTTHNTYEKRKKGERIDVANHFPLVLVKKWAKRPQKITQKAMKISPSASETRLVSEAEAGWVSHSQPVIMAILTQLGTEQNWEV